MPFGGKINKRRSSSVVLSGIFMGSAVCSAASQSVSVAGNDLAKAMQNISNDPGFFEKHGALVLKTVFGVILAVAAVGTIYALYKYFKENKNEDNKGNNNIQNENNEKEDEIQKVEEYNNNNNSGVNNKIDNKNEKIEKNEGDDNNVKEKMKTIKRKKKKKTKKEIGSKELIETSLKKKTTLTEELTRDLTKEEQEIIFKKVESRFKELGFTYNSQIKAFGKEAVVGKDKYSVFIGLDFNTCMVPEKGYVGFGAPYGYEDICGYVAIPGSLLLADEKSDKTQRDNKDNGVKIIKGDNCALTIGEQESLAGSVSPLDEFFKYIKRANEFLENVKTFSSFKKNASSVKKGKKKKRGKKHTTREYITLKCDALANKATVYVNADYPCEKVDEICFLSDFSCIDPTIKVHFEGDSGKKFYTVRLLSDDGYEWYEKNIVPILNEIAKEEGKKEENNSGSEKESITNPLVQ